MQDEEQYRFLFPKEIIVDNFAGGGGASEGLKQVFRKDVDIAINHDPEAIAMHKANHPKTKHYPDDVFSIDPQEVIKGRNVGLAWFSPDCKHFSKAKGGKPVDKKIRGLAWIVIKWAKLAKPRVIMLENVEEFQDWGPLDKNNQPCLKRKGLTFRRWKKQLENLGYKVEYRQLRACDYGAPTIRKRLFLVARCDGQPIVWPEPTHGPGLIPYRTAAECIDWAIHCPSIFERKRPLAENTLKRIAKGIQRYVIDSANPFIVPIANYNGSVIAQSIEEPLRTVTASPKGGSFALVTPFIQRHFGNSVGHGVNEPSATVTAGGGGKSSLVTAFLAKHYGGVVGHEIDKPAGTITTKDHHAAVTSHLIKLRGSCKDGQDIRQPVPTLTAGGNHIGEVRAFLVKYYGTAIGQSLSDPMHTVTGKHRLGLVTVAGEDYQIVDIGMRMLSPRELYRAQGFDDDYIIDLEVKKGPNMKSRPLTKTAQVRLCGNSVNPQLAKALAEANLGRLIEENVA